MITHLTPQELKHLNLGTFTTEKTFINLLTFFTIILSTSKTKMIVLEISGGLKETFGLVLQHSHSQIPVDATTATARTADVLLVRLAGKSSSGSTVLTQCSDAGLEVIHKLDMGVLRCNRMELGYHMYVIHCPDPYARKVSYKFKLKQRHKMLHMQLAVGTMEMFGLEYYIVKDKQKTWQDARNDCVQKGYDLTSVISLEEANFLRELA